MRRGTKRRIKAGFKGGWQRRAEAGLSQAKGDGLDGCSDSKRDDDDAYAARALGVEAGIARGTPASRSGSGRPLISRKFSCGGSIRYIYVDAIYLVPFRYM
jgi:hypothetical protein